MLELCLLLQFVFAALLVAAYAVAVPIPGAAPGAAPEAVPAPKPQYYYAGYAGYPYAYYG